MRVWPEWEHTTICSWRVPQWCGKVLFIDLNLFLIAHWSSVLYGALSMVDIVEGLCNSFYYYKQDGDLNCTRTGWYLTNCMPCQMRATHRVVNCGNSSFNIKLYDYSICYSELEYLSCHGYESKCPSWLFCTKH